MSKHLALVSAAVLALGLAGAAVTADAAAPRIHRQRIHQQERIDQGVRSGSLTPRETARLERGQARVVRDLLRARMDGRFTPRERARILSEQRVQSRRIWRAKHNGRGC